MHRGYVKLWRKSVDSGLIENCEAWAVWTYILLKASHKPHRQLVGSQIVNLSPGQLVVGRKALAERLNLTERKIRTCLDLLKKLQNVTIKTTNKYSVITVVNWSLYQGDDQQSDQQKANERPASDQQTTTNKNEEEFKNVGEEENTYSASADAVSGDTTADSPFYLTRKKRKLTEKRLEAFERFWSDFDYKRGKAEAADAWLDIPKLTNSLVDQICFAASQEAARRPQIIASGKTPKMAQGWIAGRRWEDDLAEPGPNTGNAQTDQNMLVAQKWAAGEAV